MTDILQYYKINPNTIKKLAVPIRIIDIFLSFIIPRFEFKGGNIPFFLFRRRFRKVFDIIISTYQIYLAHEVNKEKIVITNSIIDDIISAKKDLERRERGPFTRNIVHCFSYFRYYIANNIITQYFRIDTQKTPTCSFRYIFYRWYFSIYCNNYSLN